MQTFTIADSFDACERPRNNAFGIDMNAPLPLGYQAAIKRAAQLRNGNPRAFKYPVISEVMATYHGFKRCPQWWQKQLVDRGMVARDMRRFNNTSGLKHGNHRPKLRAVA